MVIYIFHHAKHQKQIFILKLNINPINLVFIIHSQIYYTFRLVLYE